MNIWSYSIFGRDTKKYYAPMKKNFELAKKNNAKIIISIDKDDKNFILDYFLDYKSEFILEVYDDVFSKKYPKILRYLIGSKYRNNNFFYKDSDSIVTENEINIMNDWLENAKSDYLIFRNHPVHVAPILAGMFAIKASKVNFIVNTVQNFFNEKYLQKNNIKFTDFDYDQVFLQMEVYEKIRGSASIYSSHFYFCNENIIPIGFNENFIGRQAYKEEKERGDEWYFKIYDNDLLCIPYIHKLYHYYKFVRVSLYLSKLFKQLSLIRHYK